MKELNHENILNNQVEVSGYLVGEFKFNHEVFSEGFYSNEICITRLSGHTDIIPIIVSERLLDVNKEFTGKYAVITGHFRSYNKTENGRTRLILSIFAREIEVSDTAEFDTDKNSIVLNGFICKDPVYRETPLGREISDVLLAVNRPYGKSDYIPCICWGRNAKFIKNLVPGDNIEVYGRLQSRTYSKRISDTEIEERVCYEVSVNKIKCIKEEE